MSAQTPAASFRLQPALAAAAFLALMLSGASHGQALSAANAEAKTATGHVIAQQGNRALLEIRAQARGNVATLAPAGSLLAALPAPAGTAQTARAARG